MAIVVILLFALCMSFQSSVSASNPTHIDRGSPDVYITAGHDAVIQLRLWTINRFGDDWPLEGTIDIYSSCNMGSYTVSRDLGSRKTSYLGDTAFKVGSDFTPGHIYTINFLYDGDPNAGYATCMNVTSLKAGYSEKVYLNAKLWNDNNKEPLANRNVTFTVYRTIGNAVGKAIFVGSAMTDSNGIAVLPYRVPPEMGCKVVASYNGENLISSCSGSGNIAISRDGAKNTRMYGVRITGYNGEVTNLTSQLTDSNGNPIANKSITFRINDAIVGSAITDSNGTATLTYNITQTKGTYNFDACFYGDGTYDNCIGSGNLIVNPIQTKLSVNNITSNYGSETNLTAKLTDNNGAPLVNKNVTFIVNNQGVGIALTDETGTATISYNISQNRTKYNLIEAGYSGDDVYGSCFGRGILWANPNTILTVDKFASAVPFDYKSWLLKGDWFP